MADVLRVSLLGALPSGESWSVNPVYQLIDSTDPVTYTELNTLASAILAIPVPADLKALWSGQTSLTGVRLEARSYTGDLETIVEKPLAAPVTGTGSQGHPFQTSMVTSLRTVTPGGRGRGRLYWPATGVATNSGTLRPAAAVVNAAVAAVKTYLSGIEAAITPVLGTNHLVVWSRTYPGSHQVTRLLMGDVLDVQRRRRDALSEAYSESVYP